MYIGIHGCDLILGMSILCYIKRQLADQLDVHSEKLLKPVSFDGLGLYFLKRSLLKTTECFHFAVQYSITRERMVYKSVKSRNESDL
jgi:hypothetical protein